MMKLIARQMHRVLCRDDVLHPLRDRKWTQRTSHRFLVLTRPRRLKSACSSARHTLLLRRCVRTHSSTEPSSASTCSVVLLASTCNLIFSNRSISRFSGLRAVLQLVVVFDQETLPNGLEPST